jgi:hypothetical protein
LFDYFATIIIAFFWKFVDTENRKIKRMPGIDENTNRSTFSKKIYGKNKNPAPEIWNGAFDIQEMQAIHLLQGNLCGDT